MDRNSQRQNRREAASCTAAFVLNTSALPAGRPSPACAPALPGPSAFAYQGLTACPPLPAEPRLIPAPILVSSDPVVAYCPTAGVSYGLTGATAYSLSAGAQIQGVFLQSLTGINNNQLNYLYDIVPSASADIISYSLAGNTASVQGIVKLTLAQTEQLMADIVSAKFLVDTLAVEEARNGLLCQTYNDAQYATCPTAAYFGPSSAVPSSLKPYAVTAYTATGSFVTVLNLVSSTGDQEAFRLANIASLTAAKEEADTLARDFVERQLLCIYGNDSQQATCHTGAGSSIYNLGYTYEVPTDTLGVLPELTPRVGSFSVSADTVFSNISKTAANSNAASLALSSLVCYYPNEDISVACGSTTVASPYPVLGSFDNYGWSATANSVTVFSSAISVVDIPYNTRIIFDFSAEPTPAGLTSGVMYYSATAYSVSGGIAFKLNSATGTQAQYESGYTGYLVDITNTAFSATAARLNILTDYTTGRYSYALRGRVILNDISSSVTAATDVAQSNLASLLECYWANGTASATCAPQSFTGVDGNWYTIPASPTTSPVYSYTVDANSIISFASQLDADQQALEQAENNLQCYYCNLRVDPLCTPEGASAYSDGQLPLDPNDFIPNCWSINATSGMPPDEICDIFAPGAQNTAITISSIPLRDKKITEDVCCYESKEVTNTIFCETGAVRGLSGLNSQDSFYLPSGTIILCSTGGVPPRPSYRFEYSNLWVASSFDYFCCTGSSCYNGTATYVGTLYGDASLAFSTNTNYTVFYTGSSTAAPAYDFSSSGPHGFNAFYLIQDSPGSSAVARDVVTLGGIPSSGTRNIGYCGACSVPKVEYNFDIVPFTLPYSAEKISAAVSTLLCNNLALSNTSVNIYSYSSTALNNLQGSQWYAYECGSTPYYPVTATTGYVLADISATGFTKYMVFSSTGQNTPYITGTATYPGTSSYSVGGVEVTTSINKAISDIFCQGGSATYFTVFSNSSSAFSPNNSGERKWYSSTCGSPFAPNSGTSYVIGYTSVTGAKYYTVFGTSGSNSTYSAVANTGGCYGIFSYDVIPASTGCSAPVSPVTLYSSVSGAFTYNASATAYFYTAQYDANVQYQPIASIVAPSYLNWFSPNGNLYYRSTTGATAPFAAAIACSEALYPITVYFSNTSADEVCNYPWAVGASGLSGYNKNVATLYSDNPYPFDLNQETRFFTAANTGSAYIFNNGASGSTTYLAPYNNITDYNSKYRAYTNGPAGVTATSLAILSYTGANNASVFNAVSTTGDTVWQQEYNYSPCSTYTSLALVNPSSTSVCETTNLYTDIPEVFIPKNYYTNLSNYKKYYPGYTNSYIMYNDGIDVDLGLATAPTSSTLLLSDLTKIGAVFNGAVLQTSGTSSINIGAYVSNVDLVTGEITLAGGYVNTALIPGGGINLRIIGINLDAPLYSTNTTVFNLTSSANLGRGIWSVGGTGNKSIILSSAAGKLKSNDPAELYSYLNGYSPAVGDIVTIQESPTASATAYTVAAVNEQSLDLTSGSSIVSPQFLTPAQTLSVTGANNSASLPVENTLLVTADMQLLSGNASVTGLSWWDPSKQFFDVTWVGGSESLFVIKNTSASDLNGLQLGDKVVVDNFTAPVIRSSDARSVSGSTLYFSDTSGLHPNMYVSLAPTGANCRRVISLSPQGVVDQNFVKSASASAIVRAINIDDNTGNIFIGGDFTEFGPATAAGTYYGATAYERLVALSPTGVMIGEFDGGIQNNSVYTIKCLDAPTGYSYYDGMVVVGGSFTSIQQQGGTSYTPSRLVRYAPVGSNYLLDPAFFPTVNLPVRAIDYNFTYPCIYIGGEFSAVNSTLINGAAALNLDGTLYSGFNARLPSGASVLSILKQSDNTLLLGGGFNSVSGYAITNLTKVDYLGVCDTGFAPNPNQSVVAIAKQIDDKLVVGGLFTSIGGTARNKIARLNSDGTIDPTFNVDVDAAGQVNTIQIDNTTGDITFGGTFNSVNSIPRFKMARVNANGVLDATFNPKFSSTQDVNTLAITPSGTIWAGGSFTQVGATASGLYAGTTGVRIKEVNSSSITLYSGVTAFADTGSYFVFAAPTGPTPGGITMGQPYFVYSLSSSGADTLVQLKNAADSTSLITLTNNDTAPFTHKVFKTVLPGYVYNTSPGFSVTNNLPVAFSGTANSVYYNSFPVGISAGTTYYIAAYTFGTVTNSPYVDVGYYFNVKSSTATFARSQFVNFSNSAVSYGATTLNVSLDSIIPSDTYVVSNSGTPQLNNSVFVPAGATVSFSRVISRLALGYPDNKIYVTSSLVNKLKPGSMLSNGGAGFASVKKVEGNYVSVNPVTSGFMSAQSSRVISLGRQYIQFWNDNNKQSAVTGYYQDSATSSASYVYKDQLSLMLRGKSIQGVSGSTSYTSSFYISSSTCSSYPGGQSAAVANPYPAPYYGTSDVLSCSGGEMYQYYEYIIGCDGNPIPNSSGLTGPLPYLSTSGYIIDQCSTGAGTAYKTVQSLRTSNTLYVYTTPCSSVTGSSQLVTSEGWCALADINDLVPSPGLSLGYSYYLGEQGSTIYFDYTLPCAYPCSGLAPASAPVEIIEEGLPDDIPTFNPAAFGDFSPFNFESEFAVGTSASCNPKQDEADYLAQELANSFVRCYYLNELQSYTECPGPSGNAEATILLNVGVVQPGTFVSTVSQNDANAIANEVAKGMLTCVTPDQINQTVTQKFDYFKTKSVYLKSIAICDSNGNKENVFVLDMPDIVPDTVTGKKQVYLAYYTPEEYDSEKEVALKKPQQ